MRKLVLDIPAQASGKNLTRPLMLPAATIRPASAPLRYNLVNSLQLRSVTSNNLTRLFVWLLCFASGARTRRLNSAPWSLSRTKNLFFADVPFARFSADAKELIRKVVEAELHKCSGLKPLNTSTKIRVI